MKRNIGIFHYKVGGTDGVSLEIEKWKHVLEEMGHAVHLCAGDLGSLEGTLIEEMYHHLPEIKRLTNNTFSNLEDFDAAGYQNELQYWVGILEKRIQDFIQINQINFLIAQNVWSVGLNPAVAIALERVRQYFQLPAIAHNHDFYFERPNIALTCHTAIELADKYLPPRHPQIKHVVINSLAQQELHERKAISTSVVPNVFDFSAPAWEPDEFNQDFRSQIGLKPNDVMILQATRIVTRKGIELAVDFVAALNTPLRRFQMQSRGLYNGQSFDEQSRIVLVLAGYSEDDVTGNYKHLLSQKAEALGVELLFIEDRVSERRESRGAKKIYSLWDTYVFADFVTYPSLWEGWGNQLLEAIRARLPILLFEYPVYQADLKRRGLNVVTLGSQTTGRDQYGLVTVEPAIIANAAEQAVELLINPLKRREVVDYNFCIAQKHYSMDALRDHLEHLMSDLNVPSHK